MAVACGQLWLAAHDALSPWCGGGFGMFSTTDGWGARRLRAVALGPGLRTELAIPRALTHELERALALPNPAHLRAMARALVPHAPHDLEPPEAIRVEVFARRHDPETLEPSAELLRSFELRLAGDDAP